MMWIRSQEQDELVKCENILLVYDNGTYIIKSFIQKYNYLNLGTYSTKEKALKVLNDIEETMCYGNGSGFYQMPKDNEVEDDEN